MLIYLIAGEDTSEICNISKGFRPVIFRKNGCYENLEELETYLKEHLKNGAQIVDEYNITTFKVQDLMSLLYVENVKNRNLNKPLFEDDANIDDTSIDNLIEYKGNWYECSNGFIWAIV